jgi:hypothetical protein
MSIPKLWIIKILKKIAKYLLIFILVFVWIFAGWPVLWQNPRIPPKTEQAKAATFQMQVGYYVGTGATLSISGLGFQPQLVIIKADTTAGTGPIWKSSAMPSSNSAYFTATANNTGSVIQFDSDGFTVSASTEVNTAGAVWKWIAFAGSDCSSNGTFCVGTYTGNGAATQTITTGFAPDLVWVKRSTAVTANWRSSAMATNIGQYFIATNQDTTGTLYTTLNSNGFTVGSTNNVSGATYYYVAFKQVSGALNVGSYTGDGTDNRNITGVGFVPNFVFVKNANAATAVAGVFNITDSYGDYSSFFTDTASAANYIQALQTDGFQVGSASNVNGSGNTIYYAAFGGAANWSASGSFQMTTGSYVGTGSSFSITGLGFQPDLVIIKDSAANYAVFRTRVMPGDSTAYLANAAANFTGGITALGSDGFTIGTSAIVNTSGNTYYWEAFGGAFNPITNSGSTDFAIGAYTGNGIDNRNITRLPFQPDLVTIKRNGTSVGVWRTSALSGDLSSYFSATADGSDIIQTLNSDGFQIGTSGIVNSAAGVHWWFAFKSGSNFAVGSYTGNGTSQNITSVGFQSDLVWVKQSTAVRGAFRPSSLLGNSTQVFLNVANITNAITGFISNGFSVGSAGEVNTSGGTYRYAAWKATYSFNQSAYRFFANLDSTDVGTALANQDISATLNSAGQEFRLRLLIHNNVYLPTSVQSFKLQFGTSTGGNCTSSPPSSWSDVTNATAISYNDNPTPADGAGVSASTGDSDPSHSPDLTVLQTYEEANNFTSVSVILSGQDGLWDFSLKDNGAPANTTYCLRVVKSDGSLLDTYSVIPQITTASSAQTPTLTFSISDNTIGFGTLSASAPRFATGDGAGSASEVSAHTISVSTNATDGYVITIDGTTLTYGSNTINPIGGTATNVSTGAGTEQFGIRLTLSSGTGGSVTSPYNGSSNFYAFDTANFPDQIASGLGDGTTDTYSVFYAANISNQTEAGNYTAVITYIATGTF